MVGGAEAEYAAACGAPAGHVPLDLFERDRPEVRADVATGSPTTGLGATLAPVQPFVFSESIAPRLGIAMPQTGTGAYSEATISTSLTAAAKAKGAAQESTAAVLTTVTANPPAHRRPFDHPDGGRRADRCGQFRGRPSHERRSKIER